MTHSQKSAHNEARQISVDRGGRILSVRRINGRLHGRFECATGHRWSAALRHIKAGTWCPSCAGRGRVTIRDMQRLAAERGGKCVSSEYINTVTPLRWRCSEGHEWLAK